VADPKTSEGPFSFILHGARFDEMPLARVARYMTLLAELAGDDAVFVRITPTRIVFRDRNEVDAKGLPHG
jgi:hypothetical protein